MLFELFSYLDTALGLITGMILTALALRKDAKKKKQSLNDEKAKLENEVLSDKVKQLEAKIKTLEKALEINPKV